MTKEQIELKGILEDRESSFDSAVSELFDYLGVESGDELLEAYSKISNLIQDKIKSKFPEGTEFGNF
jgi:hypothetical protein